MTKKSDELRQALSAVIQQQIDKASKEGAKGRRLLDWLTPAGAQAEAEQVPARDEGEARQPLVQHPCELVEALWSLRVADAKKTHPEMFKGPYAVKKTNKPKGKKK